MSRDSALRVLDYALCLVTFTGSASASQNVSGSDSEGMQKPSNVDPESVVVANCSKFVEVLGLRTIFPLFMHCPRERVNKSSSRTDTREKVKSLGGPTAAEMEEHIIK
ncbi:hypothetical protein P879_12036 [Paragonimus westermani]|uniref:Beta-catenin-like protein 1 N-terminal domain-containing protein n=1 Tax=Paragonimus westermani TaxID=34504 RepID=A0A8T0DAL1_9TREM|nr:hypothetical protein P879_12036 [Paragonimus westermani]